MGKKIIAVIDDVDEHVWLVERTMHYQGFHVLPIVKPDEAISKLTQSPPHIILLDIMMPKIDGIQMIEEIRKVPILKSIPIIMMSAVNKVDVIKNTFALGAIDYILKPINPQFLISKVKQVLRNKISSDVYAIPQNVEDASVVIPMNGRIMSIGEHKLILNSDVFFLKYFFVDFNSGYFKEIGMEVPKMKTLKNIMVMNHRFKYKNELIFVGLKEEELKRIRRWANSNRSLKRE